MTTKLLTDQIEDVSNMSFGMENNHTGLVVEVACQLSADLLSDGVVISGSTISLPRCDMLVEDSKILYWNVHGAISKDCGHHAQEMIREYHPSIFILMETHSQFKYGNYVKATIIDTFSQAIYVKLIDLRAVGSRFTWSRMEHGNQSVSKHLHRAFYVVVVMRLSSIDLLDFRQLGPLIANFHKVVVQVWSSIDSDVMNGLAKVGEDALIFKKNHEWLIIYFG
ncbi:hypothetical protein Lal_00028184 [Lupinus albus]|nr:hypothetical protein Lal_00028184 [Lupinus albus]